MGSMGQSSAPIVSEIGMSRGADEEVRILHGKEQRARDLDADVTTILGSLRRQRTLRDSYAVAGFGRDPST